MATSRSFRGDIYTSNDSVEKRDQRDVKLEQSPLSVWKGSVLGFVG